MVAAGFGVSIVPNSIRQVHAGVTYHAIDGTQPKAQIVLACRLGEFSRVVSDFMDVAKSLVRDRKAADTAGDPNGSPVPPTP
jgi:hypothetical protein